MVNRSRTFHRLVVVAAVPLVLAAGCSAKKTDAGVPSLNGQSASGKATTSTTVDVEKAVGKFVTCLRDQGLDVADPKVDANGRVDMRSIFESSNIQPGSTEFRTVMDKCGSLLRNAGFGPSVGDQKQRQESMLKYTACLRKQGLDVGDLTFGGPGGPGGPPGAGGAGADNPSTTVAGGTSDNSTTIPAGPDRPDFPRTQAERNARMAERLGVDINDPKVATAFSACESVLSSLGPPGGPNGGPGGAPGSGPSTTQG